jgi:transcriptional regulator GlxA family with amidase domain
MPYEVRTCAERPGILRTPGDYGLMIEHGAELLATADTVVIPSWRPDLRLSQSLRDGLCEAHGRGARLVALCQGAWALAATGLADGRELTTHWSAATALAAAYPQLTVRADRLWTDLGDIVSSAGVAAALDCCLHLVRSDHGSRLATRLARTLVLAPHRGGSQAQYIPLAVADRDDADPIETAMVWARANLGDPIDLDGWARSALMARRTFTRRFRERTGSSPQQWLLQQRLDHARLLLETTDDSMDRIAAACGLGTAVNLRHHFHRVLGLPPTTHRALFRTPA